MGNDQSQLKGLEIDTQSIEVTDFWTLYSGELPLNSSDDAPMLISLFQGETVVKGQLWTNQNPLEKATQNFKIYRHPSILKFISALDRGSQKCLITERCRPLNLDLANQTNVQICLGLRSLLCSLVFLIEQANVRHLNICPSSIYVTQDGAWRMAGFEHLWKSKDVTSTVLERSQSFRYKKAIDPNEIKQNGINLEQYSFAVLCEEILKNIDDDSMPNISDFKQYCSVHLKNKNVTLRPKLSAVLLHPYFNHEFVVIHSFLTELPLKSLLEKQQFFTDLIDRLKEFDEVNVAIQMADLLLSRMVLLDATAQQCVTPYVLKPRVDDILPALFEPQTYTKFLIPKILQIFAVRDAQIRLILLEYFTDFIKFFSIEELQNQLLPQLLVGIKDTNDILVAATLRCLADLVPILGASIVVGRNRGRLFADGRPHLPDISSTTNTHWTEHRSITPVIINSGDFVSGSPILDTVDISESYESPNSHLMTERLSPDGGEDIKTTSEVLEIEEDAWSDWETDAEANVLSGAELKLNNASDAPPPPIINADRRISNDETNGIIKDVKEIEIKVIQKSTEIDDLFKDMEPIIDKTNSVNLLLNDEGVSNFEKKNENAIKHSNVNELIPIVDKSRFEMKHVKIEEEECEDGWGDEANGWDEDVEEEPHQKGETITVG